MGYKCKYYVTRSTALEMDYILKQECIPVGCVLGRSLTVWRGGGFLPSMHCFLPGGMLPSQHALLPSRGVLPSQHVLLPSQGGASFPACTASFPWGCASFPACTASFPALRQTPPPMDRITDTSKNITLATTSLRPVKM